MAELNGKTPDSCAIRRAAAETGQTVDQYHAVASVTDRRRRRRHIIRPPGSSLPPGAFSPT